MNKTFMFGCAVMAFVQMSFALTVSGVSARQRWPWNSLVDVDFTVNGSAGEAYAIDMSAVASGGTVKLYAKTFASEPIAASGSRTRVVWDLGADYPGFRADDLRITVTATPFSDVTPLYMVVDISGGKDATAYPVRYTTVAPVHTPGNADPCKTTELWLKRVKAGTVTMGSTASGNTLPVHTCTLTNDYYLGVFSLTQAQCMNISGEYNSNFSNELFRATRPCDTISYNTIFANSYNWPESGVPTGDCVCKRLMDRTGGIVFRLPTEWQWEYACRAGSTTSRYPDAQYRYKDNAHPSEDYEYYSEQGMWSAEYGTSYVDMYEPNPWGFYGMLGNVWEWVVNRNDTALKKGDEVIEPTGDKSEGVDEAARRWRAQRGGCWDSLSQYCNSYSRRRLDPWTTTSEGYGKFYSGARLCVPVVKEAD